MYFHRSKFLHTQSYTPDTHHFLRLAAWSGALVERNLPLPLSTLAIRDKLYFRSGGGNGGRRHAVDLLQSQFALGHLEPRLNPVLQCIWLGEGVTPVMIAECA